jgi:hypothetical protein
VPSGSAAGTYYYLSDGAGSVAAVTNSSGGISDSYSYDPLGAATSSGSVPNPYTFGGGSYDSTTGFYYTGSGYYDPATGQSFGCKDKGRYDPGEDLCGEDENPACGGVCSGGGLFHTDSFAMPPGGGSAPVVPTNFATEKLLDEHYNEHAGGLGITSEGEYLQFARRLLSSPVSGPILGFTRAGRAGGRAGDVVRFNYLTDEFAVMTKTGVIRTYFAPGEGLFYYLDQLEKTGPYLLPGGVDEPRP